MRQTASYSHIIMYNATSLLIIGFDKKRKKQNKTKNKTKQKQTNKKKKQEKKNINQNYSCE